MRACESSLSACVRIAALGGHLEVLQWACAKGGRCTKYTCSYTAERRHFKVVQWLHANGCPWDEWTCFYAKRGGHPKVRQWAIENGCPQVYENGNPFFESSESESLSDASSYWDSE